MSSFGRCSDLTYEFDHSQYGLDDATLYDTRGIMRLPDGSTTANLATIM
jgi:hypothetical protein